MQFAVSSAVCSVQFDLTFPFLSGLYEEREWRVFLHLVEEDIQDKTVPPCQHILSSQNGWDEAVQNWSKQFKRRNK